MTYKELKECNNTDKRKEVSDRGHNGSKLGPFLEHGSQEERYEEERKQDGGIPNHRANRNHSNADKGTRVGLSGGAGEGLDEHVSNDEEGRHTNRPDDFRKNDGSPCCTRDVARQLL